MIDIDIIRKNQEIVIRDLEKRGDTEKVKWVKEIELLDERWRQKIQEMNGARRRKNEVNRKIIEGKKEGRKCTEEIRDSKRIDLKIQEVEKHSEELKNKIDFYLLRMPNILHESVPVGKEDSENVPVRFWGKAKVWKEHVNNFKEQTGGKAGFNSINWKPLDHQDIAEKWDLLDMQRAAKISGSRFFFMKRELVILDLAIQRFAIDCLEKAGFTIMEPPFLVGKKCEAGATSMGDFEEMLYKTDGEELYLIPTSEHPIVGMHMDEVLNPKELPIKYAGVSPCFRKEAGSHGRDTKGIFRIHNFNKVEQVVFSKPEESWEWHEKLLKNAEEIFKKMEIPYRIVNICTGDIGMVAAKKYDLEAWLPGQGKYREMASCSNCTEWQSRRLNIRYFEPDGSRKYVHTLNSTAVAVQRAIIAILENNQDKNGVIKIPRVLRKYTGFDKIPK